MSLTHAHHSPKPHHMPRLLDLPTELGLRIARNLDLADAINLACSGSATVDIGESKSWSSIEIPYHVGCDRSASNLIATLDAARTGLMAAVDCRPSRRNHIRKLTIYLIPGAVPLVKALLAPPSAITVLDIEASRIDPSSVASPIAVIGSGLPLPLLTHLTLDQEFTTESELYTCLLNTPNLVSLNLRLLPHAGPDRNEHWDLPAGVPGDEDVEPKDASAAAEERKADALDSKKREMQQARESAALLGLPKLSKLNIVAKEWPSIVAAIVDHAPLLETLRIRYGILDRAGEPGRMPPPITPRRQPKIEDVFRCKSVRSFDADDGPAQHIAGQMATKTPRDWMPALTKLSMWSSVRVPFPHLRRDLLPGRARLEPLASCSYSALSRPDANARRSRGTRILAPGRPVCGAYDRLDSIGRDLGLARFLVRRRLARRSAELDTSCLPPRMGRFQSEHGRVSHRREERPRMGTRI